MGCLPIPVFALLGCGIGYLVDDRVGSLFGAGIGLLLGLLGTAMVFLAMRRANRG